MFGDFYKNDYSTCIAIINVTLRAWVVCFI